MSATTTTTTTTCPADVTRETKLREIIEAVTCSRCGGSGRMPFSVANGVCFKCGGSGRVATKRGQAARAFYRQLVETPVEAIRPGDKVHYQGFQAGGYTQPSFWATVDSVQDVAQVAAEAGSYDAALKACGSASILSNPEAVEKAAEQGATLYPAGERDGQPVMACFSGLRVQATQKNGEGYSAGVSKGSTELVALDPAVSLAIRKTVAEYQLNLTKAGKPRKGTRWA